MGPPPRRRASSTRRRVRRRLKPLPTPLLNGCRTAFPESTLSLEACIQPERDLFRSESLYRYNAKQGVEIFFLPKQYYFNTCTYAEEPCPGLKKLQVDRR